MDVDTAIERIRSEVLSYEMAGRLHANLALLAAAERVVEEVERLRAAYDAWAVGYHSNCDCEYCRRLSEEFER